MELDQNSNKSYGAQFEKVICSELTKILKKEIDTWDEFYLLKEKETLLEVAICQLVFNNENIIKLLAQRGDAIKANNSHKLCDLNKKIQKIKSDSNINQELYRPNCAYITFMNRLDREFALKCANEYSKKKRSERPKLLNHHIILNEPKNASDVQWENIGKDRNLIFWQTIIAFCCYLFLFI